MNIENLKKARDKKGLNQKEVALHLGISQQRYNYYESGKREPDNEMLKQIAMFLNVSADFLLGNSDIETNLHDNSLMFAERLKKIRKERGCTQDYIASHLSISRPSYTQYESGEREPDFETVKRLAGFFGVTTDYLLGSTDCPTPQSTIFSSRLKMLRENKNVSQTQIADVLKISRQAYNNYERAIREPDFEAVKKLAEYFNVTTDFLLGNTDDPIPQNATKKSDAEELGEAIKNIFVDAGKISPDEELSAEFKQYATELIKTAVNLDKRIKK